MVLKKCVWILVASIILTEVVGSEAAYAASTEVWQSAQDTSDTEGWQGVQGELLPVSAPAQAELYAQAAVLMDAESGRVLYEKNGEQVLAMASTTKIMTCIVALENADLEERVEVSAYAASMPKVKLYVKKGECYTLRDLLYSLMLESHNDVAVAIAEHIGKRFLSEPLQEKSAADFTTEESKQAVAAFADLMNEKATELQCENTWFITPNGLDATETFHMEDGTEFTRSHSTTAKDLATIMSYCVLHSPKRSEFLKITQTTSYTVLSLEGRNIFCTNHNAFLNMMEGAISGKTGFTNQAGYCYVGALEDDGRTYVVALLACGWPNNKTYKWSDTKKLMNYGVKEFFYRSFAEAWEEMGQSTAGQATIIPIKLPVANAQTLYIGQQAYVETAVIAAEPEKSVFGELEGLLMSELEEIELHYQMAESLEAPVQKGDVVGVITYGVNGEVYKREEIVITASLEKIDFKWCMEKIIHDFLDI